MRFLSLFLAGLLLAASATASLAADAYRGLAAAENGEVDVNSGMFIFNDKLSTFDTTGHADAALQTATGDNTRHYACFAKLPLTDTEGGRVLRIVDGVTTYNYPAVADGGQNDLPEGHISISQAPNVSNSQRSKKISAYVRANAGSVIVNGANGNCRLKP